MINFVVALAAEASPIIEHWKLKRLQSWQPFPVYYSNTCRLIITGLGRCNSAAATAWLASHSEKQQANRQRPDIWLNIGIAGHKTHPIGSMMNGHKITEQATGRCWYPCHIESPMPSENILTVDKVAKVYTDSTLLEMEASGFYSTAIRFSTSELVQCIKVVSDNSANPVDNLDKGIVTGLLHDNMEALAIYVLFMSELADICMPPDTRSVENFFTEKWHFSVTQQRKLQRLLQRHLSILGSIDDLADQYKKMTSARQVLGNLETVLNDTPVVLETVVSRGSSS